MVNSTGEDYCKAGDDHLMTASLAGYLLTGRNCCWLAGRFCSVITRQQWGEDITTTTITTTITHQQAL